MNDDTTELGEAATSLASDVLRGAKASLAASVVMGAGLLLAKKLGWLGRPPPKILTQRMLKRVGLASLARGSSSNVATTVGHFAYGAAMGAAYGLLAGKLSGKPARVAAGVGWGTAVWAASYAGWIPAVGLMPPAQVDSRSRQATMLAAHWLFGSVLGMMFDREAQPVLSSPQRWVTEKAEAVADSSAELAKSVKASIAPPSPSRPS